MLHNDYQQVGGELYSVRSEIAALETLSDVDVHLMTADNRAIPSGKLGQFRTVTGTAESFAAVSTAIARFRPDIVHAQNLFPMLGGGAIRAAGEANVPIVRSLRNYRLRCIAGTTYRRGERCLDCSSAADGYKGVLRGCYRASRVASMGAFAYARVEQRSSRLFAPSAYILLSRAMHDPLRPLLDDVPVFIKPNAVEINEASAPLFDRDREIDVVFVGRLEPEKGARIFLEMAHFLPAVSFQMIGTGSMLGELSEAASSLRNFELRGEVTRDETIEIMRKARIVAVPSMWDEPFGRVAVEALAAGCVPLVSARGGLPEIVEELGGGHVVKDDRVESWVDAINRVLRLSEPSRERIYTSARNLWTERYTLSATGKALAEIYHRVVE